MTFAQSRLQMRLGHRRAKAVGLFAVARFPSGEVGIELFAMAQVLRNHIVDVG
jgi:hypothetical protein